MPVLILLGVPKHQQTTKFVDALKQRIYAMEILKLTEKDISIRFISDDGARASEIIIFIEGLFDKPERTEEVRNTLADRVAQCAKSHCREVQQVECFIHPFDQRIGFACIKD